MATHVASDIYRRRFMAQLLRIILVMALLSGLYHAFVLHDAAVAWLKAVLTLGSAALILALSRLPLRVVVLSTIVLLYGCIALGMAFEPPLAIWMLTLPAIAFATLKRRETVIASVAGMALLCAMFAFDAWSGEQRFSANFLVNLLAAYAVLAYACIVFHGLVVHYRDELVRVSNEKRQLETARTLSAGIAHLINNEMSPILGYASLLEGKDEHERDFLRRIRDGVTKVRHHVNDLLAYAGQSITFAREPVDLAACVRDCVDALDAPGHVAIRLDEGSPRPVVSGNKQQLRDVLAHVLRNAIEAGPNQIEISFALREVRGHRRLEDGRYWRMEIRDDGKGMDEAVMKQAFQPFYSTKFFGRGMGLAAVQGAIRRHGGEVELESASGRGTICHIWLPAMRDGERPEKGRRPVIVEE